MSCGSSFHKHRRGQSTQFNSLSRIRKATLSKHLGSLHVPLSATSRHVMASRIVPCAAPRDAPRRAATPCLSRLAMRAPCRVARGGGRAPPLSPPWARHEDTGNGARQGIASPLRCGFSRHARPRDNTPSPRQTAATPEALGYRVAPTQAKSALTTKETPEWHRNIQLTAIRCNGTSAQTHNTITCKQDKRKGTPPPMNTLPYTSTTNQQRDNNTTSEQPPSNTRGRHDTAVSNQCPKSHPQSYTHTLTHTHTHKHDQ